MAKSKRSAAQKRQKTANLKQTSDGMQEVVVVAESSSVTQARNDKRVAKRNGWQKLFLETFKNNGNIRAACQYADVSRDVVFRARESDDQFAALYEAAENEAVDLLAAEAWTRAKAGSDRLLEFLLKSHRKEVYADAPRNTNVAVKIDIDGQKPSEAILGKINMMSGRLPAESTDSDG
jgi:hypothetical protein